jgi:hypothetical protein
MQSVSTTTKVPWGGALDTMVCDKVRRWLAAGRIYLSIDFQRLGSTIKCVSYYTCRKHFSVLSSFMTYRQFCGYSNTTGAISGAGTAYPSRAPEFTPIFSGIRVTRSLVLCLMFYRSLFFLLSFFLVIVLSVLRFMDSDYPFNLVSSNSSYYPLFNIISSSVTKPFLINTYHLK